MFNLNYSAVLRCAALLALTMGFASMVWAQACTTDPFDPRPLPLCDTSPGGDGTLPDFFLSPNPTTAVATPGASVIYQVTVNPLNDFAGSVQLSASGASATFSPNPTTTSSTMTVTNGSALGSFQVTITGVSGRLTRTTSVVLISSTPPVASRFVPVTPCRVADTRNATGPFGGPFLTGGTSREFDIPNSACNIPSTALAYSFNATVVPHGSLGFLRMFPCGQTQPFTANLNSLDGRVKAVAAIVGTGANGGTCVFADKDTDLILDINGYFVLATNSNALAFYPITPCRLADTRGNGFGGQFGPPSLVGNATRTFSVSGFCNVPATAQAYSLNLTAVPNGSLGFITIWPAGQPQPTVSTLNAPTGTVTANAAIVTAGTNGAVAVLASNNTDLVMDINGYFAPPGPGGLSLFPLTPCRMLDTRHPPATFNGTHVLNITTSGCGASASAQAYVLNATAIPVSTLGYLTLWPDGSPQPLVSTLNALDGAITSNMAIVPTSNGSIDVFAPNTTNLVLDIFGYFAP